ncbi:MAG: shikimate dehydrogenase [Acidibacillus sp.]|uniref:Shikimate dehydrogenase (NADP(+)) n=1 Tax=Sulfoacidibacillus ferrooxidans TaxID=2005001 RepID=A0A9X1V8A3_9BACL|nr:shikimate dehydrogenase [Sulfoacidibacillus ferrooxidans]MCI0181918.1 Shikimate dehydrogenase (NADP(+)) [Sulfoacidibacillus ferrooxidans]MCY0892786.1 shikimate dehydrogenase [Acidibacillus sp.]
MPDLLAVLGHPIRHSFSPIMHQAAIVDRGLDAVYTAIDVAPEQLRDAFCGMRVLGFLGANLTIPHKERALEYMDELTDRAQRIGAVNTVIRDKNRLIGDNTDGAGWLESITTELSLSLTGVRAVVIGAGGAAHAICDALLQAGCESLTIANRDVVRAQTLAVHLQTWYKQSLIQVVGLDQLSTDGIDLLINTTPVGMHGLAQGQMPIAEHLLHSTMIVSDLVYRPMQTPLLLAAKNRGALVHGGLGMLIAQGALAFHAWFGCDPPRSVMEQAILHDMKNHHE